MAKVSTSITIDTEVKAKAQELFADLGLDLSTAINMFLRQSIRENGIPFTVRRGAVQEEERPQEESAKRQPEVEKVPETVAEVPEESKKPVRAKPAENTIDKVREFKSYTDMDEMIRDLMT